MFTVDCAGILQYLLFFAFASGAKDQESVNFLEQVQAMKECLVEETIWTVITCFWKCVFWGVIFVGHR